MFFLNTKKINVFSLDDKNAWPHTGSIHPACLPVTGVFVHLYNIWHDSPKHFQQKTSRITAQRVLQGYYFPRAKIWGHIRSLLKNNMHSEQKRSWNKFLNHQNLKWGAILRIVQLFTCSVKDLHTHKHTHKHNPPQKGKQDAAVQTSSSLPPSLPTSPHLQESHVNTCITTYLHLLQGNDVCEAVSTPFMWCSFLFLCFLSGVCAFLSYIYVLVTSTFFFFCPRLQAALCSHVFLHSSSLACEQLRSSAQLKLPTLSIRELVPLRLGSVNPKESVQWLRKCLAAVSLLPFEVFAGQGWSWQPSRERAQ